MGDEATEFVAIMAMGRLNRYLIIVPIKNQSRTSQLDFFLNNLLSSPIKLAKPLGFLGKKKHSLSLYSHCGGLLLLSPCLLSGIPDHTVSLLLGSILFLLFLVSFLVPSGNFTVLWNMAHCVRYWLFAKWYALACSLFHGITSTCWRWSFFFKQHHCFINKPWHK